MQRQQATTTATTNTTNTTTTIGAHIVHFQFIFRIFRPFQAIFVMNVPILTVSRCFDGVAKHATFVQSQHVFVVDGPNMRPPPAFQEPCSGGCWRPARKLQRAPRQPFFKFPANQPFSQHRNLRGDFRSIFFTTIGENEGGERGEGRGQWVGILLRFGFLC